MNWKIATKRMTTAMAFATMNKPRRILRGVVFDMDGTLTVPNLDFGLMYQKAGVSKNDDILQAIGNMSKEDAKKANAVIDEMEEEGRRTLELKQGAAELLHWLAAHNLPIALVTRNTSKSAQFLVNLLQQKDASIPSFDPIISRDTEHVAHKPDPAALFAIAKHWSIENPQNILMVGDSPANDITFGKNAGAATALLESGRQTNEEESGKTNRADDDNEADIAITELTSLAQQIWTHFDIDGPLGTSLEKFPSPKPTTPAAIAATLGDIAKLQSMSVDELSAHDETGNTPLIWASEFNQVDVTLILLQTIGVSSSAYVNRRGYLGATAACRAARLGHTEILDLLVGAQANLDIPNDKLQYPLHFAAFKEKGDAVKILLAAGANTRVLDRKGRIPAQDTKNKDIRDLILASM
jgi:HAD superfamily hydrolase (TIGR01549 family)